MFTLFCDCWFLLEKASFILIRKQSFPMIVTHRESSSGQYEQGASSSSHCLGWNVILSESTFKTLWKRSRINKSSEVSSGNRLKKYVYKNHNNAAQFSNGRVWWCFDWWLPMTDEAEPITETKIRWVFYTTFGSGKKGFSGKRASCTQMLRKSEICTQMLIFQKINPLPPLIQSIIIMLFFISFWSLSMLFFISFWSLSILRNF